MGAAVAQSDFPTEDLSYVIPFGPGGESDISARFQQEYFKEITGQEAVIEYKPGGGGAVAWSQFNDMPSDGHTIIGTNLPHIILQPLAKDVGFETSDLNNTWDHVLIMLVLGVVGWFLNRAGFKPSPIVLGLILGPIAEQGFVQAVLMGQAQGAVVPMFFRGPISWTIVAIIVIATLYPLARLVLGNPRGSGEVRDNE